MASLFPGSSLGRYRVIEQLGRGGMATVFRCHDPNLDRHVAAKVLPSYHTEDPSFVARFTQEAQTVARLNHPNILQIYDFGEDKGFSYIVTEYVSGGDLQDLLKGEPLSPETVLEFMGPLAEALDYAHGQGIIHRDLKPANVLLDQDRKPILADFGLARMLESTTRFTQQQQAIGTPEYMSPEQAMGADADHRSDLYALGVMVYQLLLGDTPFRADTPAATLMAHVHQPLPLPTAIDPNMDRRLEATLLKSLAKDPNDRFQSAGEMVEAISLAADVPYMAAPRQEGGDTAVMEAGGLPPDAPDADTAVVEPAGAARTGVEEAPVEPALAEALADEAETTARRPPTKVLVGGGVAAAIVVVVAIVAVLSQSGGEPEAELAAVEPPAGEPAAMDAAATEPTAEPTAVEAPAPVNLAEALAALEGVTSRAEETVLGFREVILPENAVETQFRTRDQLVSITKGIFRRDTTRQQVFEAEELYKVLELMDEEQALEDILTERQLQHVYALFDDESEAVYVLSDTTAIGPLEEYAYASAFMGGVQQQMFDVASMRRRARQATADQFRALSALVSGDVAQVGQAYISTFTEEQMAELTKPIPDNKLLQAPTVIQKTVLFPQREGAGFVAHLYGTDGKGWEGVNEAYSRPPLSTEHILHPEKYLA